MFASLPQHPDTAMPSRKNLPSVQKALLIPLALLIILGTTGLLYFTFTNQVTQNHALGNSTSQVNGTPQATMTTPNATANAKAAAATVQANTQATAYASASAKNLDPYPPTAGRLTFSDPLSQPSQWWVEYPPDPTYSGTCQFTHAAYHVNQSQQGFFYCPASTPNLSNFAFEGQMTILKGDCGGIVFRYDSRSSKLYRFEVCQDGSYTVYRYLDPTDGKQLTTNDSSPAIHTGLNQPNVIAVVANGSTLDLYVNYQKIDSVNDTSYGNGQIALAVTAIANSTEVGYKDAKLWVF
jgi:hypothetical protein